MGVDKTPNSCYNKYTKRKGAKINEYPTITYIYHIKYS